MRLSQDAQWALRYRAAHTRPYEKKVWHWLPFGIAVVVLAGIAAVLIAGCSTSTSVEPTCVVWECVEAPHIWFILRSYDSDGYGYFDLLVSGEDIPCRAELSVILSTMADGHWKQLQEYEPVLLPPPSHWGDGISDKLEWVKINGSDAMPMQTLTPLPNDKQITIEKVGTK